MTGYGQAVLPYREKKIHVEIKSLNSKTLDLSTRIAPLYREKELEVRQCVAAALVRGKVDVSVWIEKDAAAEGVPINAQLVACYYKQLRQLTADYGIPEPQDWVATIMRMPDVMSRTEIEVLDADEWQTVRQALAQAIEQLVAFRKQEGAALEKMFTEKVGNIERLLGTIEQYERGRVDRIRSRIEDALTSIPAVDYDRNRLEQEMIYYIEKLDISEEKQRLANHLKYFRDTMADGEAQGKKLGFIAQEMGREINTTGSKSNQAEMQNIVVMMKDELEQIKEQVLNVL